MTLELKTLEAVSTAGELLIRAAATLATLSDEQLGELADVTMGSLPNDVHTALAAAAKVSPSVAQSLKTHPPRGLLAAS